MAQSKIDFGRVLNKGLRLLQSMLVRHFSISHSNGKNLISRSDSGWCSEGYYGRGGAGYRRYSRR